MSQDRFEPMDDAPEEFRAEWTAEGHVTEDSVYAWLDEALGDSDSERIASHIAGCEQCSAAVAEARGFIAASARIIGSLDTAPRAIVPHEDVARTAAGISAMAGAGTIAAGTPSGIVGVESDLATRPLAGRKTAAPWYRRSQMRAAAALLIVAGGASYVATRSDPLPATTTTTTAVAMSDASTPALPKSEVAAVKNAPAPSAAAARDLRASAPAARKSVTDVSSPSASNVAKATPESLATVASAETVAAPQQQPQRFAAKTESMKDRAAPAAAAPSSSARMASGAVAAGVRIATVPPAFAQRTGTDLLRAEANAIQGDMSRVRCLVAIGDTTRAGAPTLRALFGKLGLPGSYTLTVVGWPTPTQHSTGIFELSKGGALEGQAVSDRRSITIELQLKNNLFSGTARDVMMGRVTQQTLLFAGDTSTSRCAQARQ